MSGRPVLHHLSENAELAEVVGGVSREQGHLTEHRMAGCVRERRQEIGSRIGDVLREALAVRAERLDAPGPRCGVSVVPSGRPVAIGVLWRDVLWFQDVLNDVPLADTEMLDERPERVVDVRRTRVDGVHREVGDGLLEAPLDRPVQEIENVLADRISVQLRQYPAVCC